MGIWVDIIILVYSDSLVRNFLINTTFFGSLLIQALTEYIYILKKKWWDIKLGPEQKKADF